MLKDMEQQELSRGCYIHISILLEREHEDVSPIIDEIETIENVKCAEQRNKKAISVLLYVDDRFSHHHFAEKSKLMKFKMWRKHDEVARRAVGHLQQKLQVVLPSLGIDTYHVFFATTNPGSFYTRAAGEFRYGNGDDDGWRFYTYPNESIYNEDDKEVVRGYWLDYTKVTGDDRIFTEGMYSKD